MIPLRQGEALWLAFGGQDWHPNAVQVAVGGVNALTGAALEEAGLSGEPQNYLVTPDQPWLDGIKAGDGVVRQFVAAPLGAGVTVEGQVSGDEARGGIQVRVYEAKPGRFPDEEPARPPSMLEMAMPMAMATPMGVAAGGRMRQRIHRDPHGLDTWEPEPSGEVDVRIVNSAEFAALTGQDPPPSPVTAKTYTDYGLPWFELYDEDAGDISASDVLAKVKSVGELTGDRPEAVDVDPKQVKRLRPRGKRS